VLDQIGSTQDGWSDLSGVAQRAKAEAIPINCCRR
jgi:hypothetical protein